MAQRRMFSPQIVDSEEFITMPVSSQALYFHLGMNADDDGFIQPKIVMRKMGAAEDDLKVLLAKRFLLPFESGVVVIKHWLIHNLIQKDRYHPTRFQEEKSTLLIKENKAYTENPHSVNKMLPEVRLGKVSIDTVAVATAPKADSFFQKTKKERQDDSVEMNCAEFILMCRGSQYRHIRIIAEHADDKEPNFTTRGQWREFGRRNLKAASRLVPYSDRQLQGAMERMMKDLTDSPSGRGFISKWSLETLEKYLDES